jgi:hypothetical protein
MKPPNATAISHRAAGRESPARPRRGAASFNINYYNTNDNVLINDWRSDQDTKPALPLNLDYQYRWDGTNFLKGYLPGLLLLFPVDTYEIFSYCDEARCEAIGAQPNLRGPFALSKQLDISTLYSPSGILFGNHNGQFKSYCADTWAFWRAVLVSVGLKQQ